MCVVPDDIEQVAEDAIQILTVFLFIAREPRQVAAKRFIVLSLVGARRFRAVADARRIRTDRNDNERNASPILAARQIGDPPLQLRFDVLTRYDQLLVHPTQVNTTRHSINVDVKFQFISEILMASKLIGMWRNYLMPPPPPHRNGIHK